MSLVTATDELTELCERTRRSDMVTVDTEFMREKTFWPQLCVVQVAGEDDAFAVDALADGIDLQPLFDLMADESVLKVFHAARQDLEIFYNLTGRLPTPLFDTQIAAMVCGFGESAGYETLVRNLVGAKIDKSSRFTDWARRPLTDKQIDYALADVTHLRQVYAKLNAKLNDNGRRAWLSEEVALMTALDTYRSPPELAYKRIKVRSPKPRLLAVLRELAAWREIEAQTHDVPRNRILRDEALLEIAHNRPKDVEHLSRTRGLSKKAAEGEMGKGLLNAVRAGLDVPDEDCPEPDQSKPRLPHGIGPITDLLKVLLKFKCEEHGVAQKLVGTSDDLEKIAAFGEKAGVAGLSGWRREVFGEDALRLRAGELAVIVNRGKLELVDFVDEDA